MKRLSKEMKWQWSLSFPSAMEYIIMTLISIVDTFAISYLGSNVIAAVGAMISVIDFFSLVTKSIQVSNNVTIARAIGEGNEVKVKVTTGTSIFIAIFFQLICFGITVLFGNFLPDLFQVDKICLTYLYIRMIGSIPAAISMVLSGHARTLGKSKAAMNARIGSLVINILLDYLAIHMGYGIAGVAFATVCIEVFYMICMIIIVKGSVLYQINKEAFQEIVRLSKHGILDRLFDRGGKLLFNVILSRLGTYEYAAHIVLNQIESFANDFCYGFSIGMTTSIGITIGKKDDNQMQEISRVIHTITVLFAILIPIIIIGILMMALPILLKEREALKIAYYLIPWVFIYTILLPIRYQYSSMIEGMKEFEFNAKLSGIINTIKIILAYLLSKILGVCGVWITFSVCYLFMIYMLKKKIRKSEIGYLLLTSRKVN